MRTRRRIAKALADKALAEMEHGSEVDAFEAAKELTDVVGQDVLAALFRVLRSEQKR
jgi:hypothetical protein